MGVGSLFGKVFHRSNPIDKASQLIAQNPDDPKGYKSRAVAYAKADKYYEAYMDLRRAIELSPEDAESYYLMGATQNKRSRHKEALESFNRSLELDPKNAGAYVGRAWTHRVLGSEEDVKLDLETGLQLTGNRYLKKMAEQMVAEMDNTGKKKAKRK